MKTRLHSVRFEALFRLVALGSCFAGCSGSGGGAPAVASVEVSPRSVLLVEQGEQYALAARVLDENGESLDDAAVTWESSSEDVTVDAAGLVTAAEDVGSAIVTARVGELRSNRATVLIVEPVANALIVSDAQVVRKPEAVDRSAPPDMGTRSTVLLTDIEPPSPGVVILPKEDALVTGRVVASEVQGNDVLVTLEAVPVTELVQNLDVRQAYALRPSDFVIRQDEFTTVTEEEDGRITVSYDVDAANEAEGEPGSPSLKQGTNAGSKFLNCRSSAQPRVTLRNRATLSFDPGLTVDTAVVVRGGELRRLLVKADGTLDVDVTLTAMLTARLVASVKCRAEFVEVPVPVGGFLNAIFVTQFPLGIGLDLEGVLEIAELTLGLEAGVDLTLTVGFEYTNVDGIENLTDFSVKPSGGPVVELPSPLEDFRVNGTLYGYLWSGFDLQALPVLELLNIDIEAQLLDVTAGPRFKVDLAFATSQATDKSYASSYGVSLFGRAGLSDGVKKLLRFFANDFFEVIPLEFVLELDLYDSPKGTLTTTALDAVAGTPVGLRVNLDETTTRFFSPTPPFSAYAVQSVEFYRFEDDLFLNSIGTILALDNQSEFNFTWTPSEEDEGLNTFVAFANSPIFGTVPFPLEVSADSRVTVNVRNADAPPVATFQFLGGNVDFQGQRRSYGADINQQGLVAGTSVARAFRWQNGVGLVDLGQPAGIDEELFSATFIVGQQGGINSSGHVVGTFRDNTIEPGGMRPQFTEEQPFVWRGGTMESLNESLDLEEWIQLCTATDINDIGSIVGRGVHRVEGGRGYIWRDGAATQLGTLGTNKISYPNAINNSDVVVGVVRAPSGRGPVGFMWDGGISELRPEGFAESEAMDINSAGQIVGRAGQVNFAQPRAFLYLPEPALGLPAGMNLLEFPSCTQDPLSGGAHAINEAGQILVSTSCAAWAIWDVGELIEIAPPDNTFTITRLERINDNGQAIGYGKASFGFPPEEVQCENGQECALLVNFEDLR